MIRNLYRQKTQELRSFFENLVEISQSMPNHLFGQLASQVLRKTVVTFAPLPLEARVGNLQMSCDIQASHAEMQFAFTPDSFESKERKLLTWFLPNDGIFVDIGADVGIYTLTAATALSNNGRVIAVEPDATKFERLRKNISKNAELYPDWPVIDMFEMSFADSQSNISNVSLLKLVTDAQLPQVDVLKIDTGGDEELILEDFFDTAPLVLFPKTICLKNDVLSSNSNLNTVFRELGYFKVFKSKTNVVYRLRLN
ncbi:MAG: hypothetical protein GJ680_06675 [Alteromonadaceae bacterium]|nr:hypothetical protein [Alteromonadaceae bacterium]